MKTILALTMFLTIANVSFANVAPPTEYPNQVGEVMLIGTSVILGIANTGEMIGKAPSYWVGGLGVAAGASTLSLLAGENPRYEKGLFAAGVFSAATGLIALWQRHELNEQANHTSIIPGWSNGSLGLALVVDF